MSSSSGEITVLVAEGHSLFREAVRGALATQPDLTVVAEVGDGITTVSEARRRKPDLVILDAHLPKSDGLRTVTLIQRDVPGCKVIVLDSHENEQSLVRAMEASATGYLARTSPLSELIDAARSVHRGRTVVPSDMLGGLISALLQRSSAKNHALLKLLRLTKREREVLALIASGTDNDAIASTLGITPETARTHVQNILNKLGVHSRLQAATFVTMNGILDELSEASM